MTGASSRGYLRVRYFRDCTGSDSSALDYRGMIWVRRFPAFVDSAFGRGAGGMESAWITLSIVVRGVWVQSTDRPSHIFRTVPADQNASANKWQDRGN